MSDPRLHSDAPPMTGAELDALAPVRRLMIVCGECSMMSTGWAHVYCRRDHAVRSSCPTRWEVWERSGEPPHPSRDQLAGRA